MPHTGTRGSLERLVFFLRLQLAAGMSGLQELVSSPVLRAFFVAELCPRLQARLGVSAFLRSIRDEHLEQLNPGAALSDPFKDFPHAEGQGWAKRSKYYPFTMAAIFAAGSHSSSCWQSRGIRRTENACIFHRN